MSEVAASQAVPLVLPNLASRCEQAHVAPDEEVVFEIGLERLGGYLSSVHVHCEEADGVVLGVKRILVVRTVVSYAPLYASLSMQHSPRLFGRVPRNRF